MQIHCGDALTVLRTLPANSVQTCITSPPYFGLRDYHVDGQLGLEPSPIEYVTNLVAVFCEVRRVLRDNGTLWLNLGDSYNNRRKIRLSSNRPGFNAWSDDEPWVDRARKGGCRMSLSDDGLKEKDLIMIPARVALALQEDGWYLRSDIIWHKRAVMPESVKDRPTSCYEHVFLLTKNSKYFYDADAIREPAKTESAARYRYAFPGDPAGIDRTNSMRRPKGMRVASNLRNARNVWTINPRSYRGAHFATMPIELAEKCIKAGTSERGCCSACGAPWQRMQKRTGADGRSSLVAAQSRYAKDECGHHLSADARYEKLPTNGGTRATFRREFVLENHDLGWAASCPCDADVVPCVVLDPFAGAGTTAFAATSLGRDSVSIELNTDYVAMAQARVGPLAAILLG